MVTIAMSASLALAAPLKRRSDEIPKRALTAEAGTITKRALADDEINAITKRALAALEGEKTTMRALTAKEGDEITKRALNAQQIPANRG